METILSIISLLALLAFIVGMVKPRTVKCSSRGKVALIYLGILIVSSIIGAALTEDSATLSNGKEVQEAQTASSIEPPTTTSNETATQNNSKPAEIPILNKGDVYHMSFADANVEIIFRDIKTKRISKNSFNLIFSLTIKNNSNEIFRVSECSWKLLDSDNVEVEEAGIYEPMFEDFMPGTFFFTSVAPNIGKKEDVGYSVTYETYYLSINGKIIAQIPVDK